MKKLLYILFALLSCSAFTQEVYIFEKESADNIRGRYGEYSAVDPVKMPDGNYLVSKNILLDADIGLSFTDLSNAIIDSAMVYDMPTEGEECTIDMIYRWYNSDIDDALSPLFKCVQTHNRTIYDPDQTSALFTFFRFQSDTMLWIENEWIDSANVRRYWDEVFYTSTMPMLTVTGQTPDITPTLWVAEQGECDEWVQPTGAQDAYNTGDCVTFEGNQYESLIDANVWSPSVYPQGWQQL